MGAQILSIPGAFQGTSRQASVLSIALHGMLQLKLFQEFQWLGSIFDQKKALRQNRQLLHVHDTAVIFDATLRAAEKLERMENWRWILNLTIQ